MDDRLTFLEARVSEVSSALEDLSRRLAALEAGAAAAPLPAVREKLFSLTEEEPEELHLPVHGDFGLWVALLGRTLVALGGGYLLRALTSAGLLPQSVGVMLAFVYALVWLYLADRAGGRGKATSAGFHGATAVLIGFPLLWEATSRFKYLPAAGSALAVALFTALAFAVAWRRNLPAFALTAGVGAAMASLAILVGTHAWLPLGLVLVLVGEAGLGLATLRGWHASGWLLPLPAYLALLLVDTEGVMKETGGVPALVLGLALCLSYLGVVSLGALGRKPGVDQGQRLRAFAVLHGGTAALLGYGGIALLGPVRGAAVAAGLGALGLLLGAGSYHAAFRWVERAERRKLLFYSGLGLFFILTGSGLLLPNAALPFAWSALAVFCAWMAVRVSRVTVSLHGTIYALAAAIASGLASLGAHAFAAPPALAWPSFTSGAAVALAAAAVCCALPVPRLASFWKPYASFTRLVQLAVLTWGAGGALLYVLVPWIAGHPGAGVDAGLLAAVRTAVLAGSALLLGWIARWERLHEAAWLVYPLLLAAGVKLLVEDFPHGRPLTLFVALALCGGALILAPRLARRAGQAAS
jgi:hypothetical protein